MDATQGIVVFICGPFRAATEYERRKNIAAAENYAKQLVENNIYYICPHLNSAHFQGIGEDSFWLTMYQELLLRCDAVLVLPGSELSSGSLGEIAVALREDIPTFYNIGEIKDAIFQGTLKKRQAQKSCAEQSNTSHCCCLCFHARDCQYDYGYSPRVLPCFVPVVRRAGHNPSDLPSHLPYTTR